MSVSTTAFWAVIPAAGVGARMAADRPKQYLQLGGRSILEHSISCFLDHPGLKGLVVSVAFDDPFWPSLPCAADPRVVRVDGARFGLRIQHDDLVGIRHLVVAGAGVEAVADRLRRLQATVEDHVHAAALAVARLR